MRTSDGRSVAVLVLVPLVLFVVPAAIGHPAITGDNLIQNFPLRALSGLEMREGHLPLWNPYIWSGSPLLGGLNAGSFYPFTFLFAVLGPVAAWVVNLLGVYWAGGLGAYALARQYRLRPLASLLGALTYAFSGAMAGQLVHLGVIEGMGWMPLLVLAELRLSWAVLGTGPVKASTAGAVAEGPAGDGAVDAGVRDAGARGDRTGSPWPWAALLAVLIGLEALTGEPRSMAESEIVAPAVALWLVLRPYRMPVAPRRRVAMAGLTVLASAWGVLLAAAELAPGWSFIQSSQRAVESYWFFGSGSLRPAWSVLLLVPDLFGGAGLFGQPRFFTNYNLPEVTGYAGLLPLSAALVLLTRSFGRRRSRLSSDWGMWLALGALGMLLAWGSYTPVGHVFHLIPLFGKTRLQSRNLEIVDLSLAVLLAFWADRLLGRREARATGTVGWRRWLAVAPPIGAIVVCVLALAAPVGLEVAFGATPAGGSLARYLWPWLVADIVLAAAVAALVLGWGRIGPLLRRRALVAVVVVDVALFLMATSTAVEVTRATLEPTPAAAAAALGTTGRFAIYDTTVQDVDTATGIGQPDLNVFTGLPSVQGYGSILSQTYGTVTGTHTLDTLDPCALERGVFAPLRLATLLTLPYALAPGVSASGKAPAPPAACPGVHPPGTAHRRVLYLGRSVIVRDATLVRVPRVAATGTPRVGLVGPTGSVRFPRETVRPTHAGWAVTLARPQSAAGIVIEGPARAVSDASTVSGISTVAGSPAGPGTAGGRWAFDGVLQDALDTSGWRLAGSWEAFSVFRRTSVRPPVWLATGAPGSRVEQVRTTDWGSAVERVVATRPATVVRSEAYLPGWRATLVPVGGGPARELSVRPDGLVQSVRVPAGTWILRFRYRPPHLTLGIAGSFVAVLGFAGVGVAGLVAARRRRGRGGPPRARGARGLGVPPGDVGSVTGVTGDRGCGRHDERRGGRGRRTRAVPTP